jgi:hypothetical protein
MPQEITRGDDMASVSGKIVETPTAQLPFKASITHEGEVILERCFDTRREAESYLEEILLVLAGGPDRIEALKAVCELAATPRRKSL